MTASMTLRVQEIIAYCLCAAVIALPFSIAVANIFFSCTLLMAFVTGAWWQGATTLWQKAKPLSIAWLLYITLMIIGLSWSPDIHRGMVIVSKQWSWLMVPVFIATCHSRIWLNRILLSISIGLTLHLILCLAQSQGMPLPVAAPGGSSTQDPAGLIGHISFGLIYGIWAAWLLHLGYLKNNLFRYALWLLALISVIMVFIVQGRSGYMVVLTLSIVMAWKIWLQHLNIRLLSSIAALMIITVMIIISGPAKDRIQITVDSLKSFSHGDLQHAEVRISLWYLAWESWKTQPLLGVGTGGFSVAAAPIVKQHPNLNLDNPTGPIHSPHNTYLMELVRWGPMGLIILLFFFGAWIKTGWKLNWHEQPHHILIATSGIALAVHGISSQSIEEYHASVYTALFLSIGLASLTHKK